MKALSAIAWGRGYALVAGGVAVLLAGGGCGGSKAARKAPSQVAPRTEQATTSTKPEEEKPQEELKVRRVIIPEVPKYVEGIDKEAQDLFKEGVIAVYETPPDYETAIEKFRAAIDKDPKFLEAYFNLGMTYERMRKKDKALEVYQEVLRANPDSLDAKAYVAKIYLAKSRDEDKLGHAARAKELRDKAKGLLDVVLVRDEDNVAANNAMALYWLMLGDLDKAAQHVTRVLVIEPRNVSALNTRGLINYMRKKYSIAKWIFEEKVLRYDPNSTEAMNNLGLTYLAMGKQPLAVKYWLKAISIEPDNIPARLNLAAIYLDYLNYQGALEQFRIVLEQQDDNVEALIGSGTALWGLQKYEDAVGEYKKAIALTDRYPELYKRIGKIYDSGLGNQEKAIEWYEKYIEIAKLPPSDPFVQTVKLLKEGMSAPKEAPEEDEGQPDEQGGSEEEKGAVEEGDQGAGENKAEAPGEHEPEAAPEKAQPGGEKKVQDAPKPGGSGGGAQGAPPAEGGDSKNGNMSTGSGKQGGGDGEKADAGAGGSGGDKDAGAQAGPKASGDGAKAGAK